MVGAHGISLWRYFNINGEKRFKIPGSASSFDHHSNSTTTSSKNTTTTTTAKRTKTDADGSSNSSGTAIKGETKTSSTKRSKTAADGSKSSDSTATKRSLMSKNKTSTIATGPSSTTNGDHLESQSLLMAARGPHWRKAKYKNMFVKEDDSSKSASGEDVVTRRQSVGYLSKRDEERYRSYIADRKKATQSEVGVGDRDKRNRVPRSTTLDTKMSNGRSHSFF